MAYGIRAQARGLAVARAILAGLDALLLALAYAPPATAAPKLTVLYSFVGGNDGLLPYGSLVAGADGSLYGTTNGGGAPDFGTVFKLTPPKVPNGKWKETILYTFDEGANGFRPEAGLIIDQDGALYGTTTQGGDSCDCGVVFQLTPPARPIGKWKYTVLHRLLFAEGANPFSGVIMDAAGAIYGTTTQGGHGGMGTVFQLKPPPAGATSKRWKFTLLHDFSFFGEEGTHLFGGLVLDAQGALYGLTEQGGDLNNCFGGCGVVFKLSPPPKRQTEWSFAVLHKLQLSEGNLPYRVNMIFDAQGALYGTTSAGGAAGWGTIFQLKPPAAGQQDWTLNVLHDFAKKTGGQSLAGLYADPAGALYGTAAQGGSLGKGTIFKLKPTGTTWQYTVLWDFKVQTQGDHPFSAVIADTDGALYATTTSGGASDHGAVVKLVP